MPVRTSRRRVQNPLHDLVGLSVPAGITPARFQVLLMIHAARGIAQRELTRALGQHPSTVTKALEALERHGLVVRAVSGHDRRSRVLRLSLEGEAQVEALVDAMIGFMVAA